MEPSHPSTNTSATVMVKCALIALLLSGLISQCSATCRRQALIHLIDHEGCTLRRVPSFGCRGTCTSYSRVSPTDYTRMERSCQCCQESDHMMRGVRLNCPELFPSTKVVEVKVAMSCTCRPCHGGSGVPSETRLEDLLQ
ncbi:bursicon-like [Acanthaster planci]|uniref:Bursicon n=1 Tax=Acanthaster planci TaxID=133434 RepID=A0A8B7XH66_ACAPL|nr:bursicon-like [Acanthaster planci]